MQISRNAAHIILSMMGTIDVSALNSRSARATLAELLVTADEDAEAVVMKNCPANNPVECIKAIRGLTGLGLKEAKDLLDELDPKRVGGTIGPIPIACSYEQAMQNLNVARGKYPSAVSAAIVVDPA